jgi:hypothetical protein
MAHDLPKQYLNLIVSCENPTIVGKEDAEVVNYEPCGCCAACGRIIVDNYYGLGEFPECYKKTALKYYVDKIHKMGYRVADEKGEEMGWYYWNPEYLKKKEPFHYQLELQFEPHEIKYEPEIGVAKIEHTITISRISDAMPTSKTENK